MKDTSAIALYGGLILSAITVLTGIFTIWITKMNDYKREVFKSILDNAYKEWEYRANLVIKISEKEGKKASILPFTDSIIFYKNLFKIINKRKIKDKDIEHFIKLQNQARKLLKEFNERK